MRYVKPAHCLRPFTYPRGYNPVWDTHQVLPTKKDRTVPSKVCD
jgi:hypothetical protein